MITNAQAPWWRFNSDWYADHNYGKVRDDDHRIMELVGDHFRSSGVRDGRGVDVGAGANLYPALAMLPFCRQIDLWELATPNIEWLTRQARSFDANWDAFWDVYRAGSPYREIDDPRRALAERVQIVQADVFELPAAQWDMGTMFFVSCSFSNDEQEFWKAVACFMSALRPGAPFAAAFMLQSRGYPVDNVEFPALPIGREQVSRTLASVAYDVVIHEISTATPLRSDYDGMLLAVGKAGAVDLRG